MKILIICLLILGVIACSEKSNMKENYKTDKNANYIQNNIQSEMEDNTTMFFYTSKDNYINVRESPKGKILFKINGFGGKIYYWEFLGKEENWYKIKYYDYDNKEYKYNDKEVYIYDSEIKTNKTFNYNNLNAEEEKFIKAVEDNDIKTVEELLKSGKIDINKSIYIHNQKETEYYFYSESKRYNALAFAVNNGNYKMVEVLIENKANINVVCEEKEGEELFYYTDYTPFARAVRLEYYDIAKYLAENGADVNSTENTDSDGDGGTYIYQPLIMVLEKGDYGFANFLLSKGANVDCIMGEDYDGAADEYYTALIRAAKLGNYEMAKFLIENGANINATREIFGEDTGETALDLAETEEIKELLRKAMNK